MRSTPLAALDAVTATDQPPLIKLLQELSDCLIAASEDPSSTQGSEGETLASKLRTVLLLLLTHCVEGGMAQSSKGRTYSDESCFHLHTPLAKGELALTATSCVAASETDFVDVLKLANIAMKRFPKVFTENSCATAAKMLQLLLVVYPEPRSRQAPPFCLTFTPFLLACYARVICSWMWIFPGQWCCYLLLCFASVGFPPKAPGALCFLRSVQAQMQGTSATLLELLSLGNYKVFSRVIAGHVQVLSGTLFSMSLASMLL